jgi:ABC-type uncharacterized transport system permease subunit
MTPNFRKALRAWILPLKSVAFGFCVFLLGSALAAWLTLLNVHGFLAFVDNFVAGIAAGLMVLLYERRRQREVDKRLQTIQLMNHYVRNALQTISAASCSVDGTEQATRCQDAVSRIEWALREVLPGEIELTYFSAPPNPPAPKKESTT